MLFGRISSESWLCSSRRCTWAIAASFLHILSVCLPISENRGRFYSCFKLTLPGSLLCRLMIFCFFLQKWDYSVGDFMSLLSLNVCAFPRSEQPRLSLALFSCSAPPRSPLRVGAPERRVQPRHSCLLSFPPTPCGLLHHVPIRWWRDVIDSRTPGISEAESPKSVVLTEAASLDCCLSRPFILPPSLWMKLYFRFLESFHTV